MNPVENESDIVSYEEKNKLVYLNRNVENLIEENQDLISSVIKLKEDIQEFKGSCDTLKLIGMGASFIGSILESISDRTEDTERAQFLKETGKMAESFGNKTNTCAELADKWKTRVLITKIKTLSQRYGQQSDQLSLEISQFNIMARERNRFRTGHIRRMHSSPSFIAEIARDLNDSIAIIRRGNVKGLTNKAIHLLNILEKSAECHEAVPLLQELIEKLEMDLQRFTRIQRTLSNSITDPNCILGIESAHASSMGMAEPDYYQTSYSGALVRRSNYN